MAHVFSRMLMSTTPSAEKVAARLTPESPAPPNEEDATAVCDMLSVAEAKMLINMMRNVRHSQEGSLALVTINGKWTGLPTEYQVDEEGWPVTNGGWIKLFESESTMLMERANVL